MAQITENPNIPQTDHFNEAFQRFQASRQFKRLEEKYRVRPFFERAKPLKVIAEVGSYLLNAFSAATAFLLVYSFVFSLVPYQVVSGFFAVAFLVVLEGLKRYSLPIVFKEALQFKRLNIGAIAFSFGLSVVSIGSSYFGAKEAVRLLTPEAELVSLEDVRKPFEDRLEQLQADKADAMKQTWKGKQTVQAARRLNIIQDQEAELQAALLSAIQQAEAQNAESLQSHTSGTTLKAEHFAAVTLGFELLLILALWYGEFYDFRSLAEFAAAGGSARTASSNDSTEKEKKTVFLNGSGVHLNDTRTVIQGFQPNAMRYANTNALCLHCGKSYERRTSWQKYCATDCRLQSHAAKHGQTFDPAKHRTSKKNVNFV